MTTRRYALALSIFALAATGLHAQSFNTQPCKDASGDNDTGFFSHFFGTADQSCETRSATVPLVNGRLVVRSQNGSIDVLGEDRHDIALEARVTAHASSRPASDALLHSITIETGTVIQAKGPHPTGGRNWAVSYRLHVPRRLAADLHTDNGALTLTALDGEIHAETTNGALKLSQLAGDIHAETTNGSIHADLTGPTWHGRGLSATTTNGAVSVSVPPAYSAHLVASTVNGGTSLNAPGANNSHITRHDIDTTFGSGGPTLTFETTNGPVSIQ